MDWEVFYNRFREPDFVPGYEIQNRLGGGAFGEVYKARKHSIGKAYAIKFLKIDDEAQRAAIERELEQVRHFAVIDHPNLVSIEDLGSVLDVPYVVMGYAGEDTLARRLRESRLTRDQALGIFVQTCRGVLALHDRRLVHFDLKPSNVFLKGEVARVGDYGLAKLMTEGRQTLSFGRGTPHYMAPEILRSRADHRADIYSLGVMFYESLTGEPPFQPTGPSGLIMREGDQPPVFLEDFPADLRRVVERCLRLGPADRYQTVEELLDDLGQSARQGDSIRFELGDGLVDAAVPAPTTAETATPPSGELRETAAVLTRGAVDVAKGVWDGLNSRPAERSGASPQPSASAPPAAPAAATIPVPPRAAGGVFGSIGATLMLGFEVLVSLLRGMGRFARAGLQRTKGSGDRGWFKESLHLVLFMIFLAALGAAAMSVLVMLFNEA
jgi:tRNA A-37 threonylcarbamoyl transferase component Bud32